MKSKKYLFFIAIPLILILLVFSALAAAKLLDQKDITLDFDPIFKNSVVSDSRSHLNLPEDVYPVSFDLKGRVIQVNFNADKTKYALIDPVLSNLLSIVGMSDPDLRSSVGKEGLAENGKDVAEQFDSVQRMEIAGSLKKRIKYNHEFVFFKEKKIDESVYRYIWIRKYEDEVIFKNYLYVDVDSGNGKIVAWEVVPFIFQPAHFNKVKTPVFGTKTAVRLAGEQAGIKATGGTVLVYYEDRNAYLIRGVDGGNNEKWVFIDAISGKVLGEGFDKNELEEIPEDYSYGGEIITKYEKTDYSGYAVYIVGIIIILFLFVFFVFYKRKKGKKVEKIKRDSGKEN